MAAGILLTLALSLQAQTTIYYDDFSDYTNGVQNAAQCNTGLALSCCGGDLPGWTHAGDNAIHAVNLNGVSQYAAMIWDGGAENVITMSTGIVANATGTAYRVGFMAGPACYAGCSQATPAGYGLVVSVLRADNSVLDSYTAIVGAWQGVEALTNFYFDYVGDGSGPVRLQITGMPGTSGDGFFSGAVNNVGVTNIGSAKVPTITTQPAGGTVFEGSDFTFTVVASEAETYQWFQNGAAVAGATGSSYTIYDVVPANAGTYYAIASNPAFSVTSSTAVLKVTPVQSYATYQAAVLADNPIHYYPLNDAAGSQTAKDLGSQAGITNARFMGGVTLDQPTGEPSLGFSTCARFDGQPGTYLDCGLWSPGNSVTVEAWVNLDPTVSQTTWHDIAGRVSSYVLDFVPGDGIQFTAWNPSGGQAAAITSTAASLGQWHFLAGSWDGASSNSTVWVDGVEGPVVAGTGIADAGLDVLIGGSRDGTDASFNFQGLIAQVAFYTNALSPAQIRAHFRNAVPGTPPLSIERAVIVSWPNLPIGFVLQSAASPAGPYQNYTGEIYTQGDYSFAPVPISSTNAFFKLSGRSP